MEDNLAAVIVICAAFTAVLLGVIVKAICEAVIETARARHNAYVCDEHDEDEDDDDRPMT